jgi:asparagine synthase (glutamine-hydrolysing)
MRLPLGYLIRDGWHKWVLRKAMQGLLPDEIVWRRRKTGFPFPYESWLSESRERFFVAMADSDVPWVDLTALREGWVRLARSRSRELWRLMSVCLWWRRCVEDRPLAP